MQRKAPPAGDVARQHLHPKSITTFPQPEEVPSFNCCITNNKAALAGVNRPPILDVPYPAIDYDETENRVRDRTDGRA